MTRVAVPFANSPIPDDVTWRRLARLWLGTGVIPPEQASASVYATALGVFADASGLNVKVRPGEAYIDGGYFADDTQQTLPINAPDATNPRIDRVVLRWDGPNNVAEYAVLQGTPAVTPTPPAATQNQGGRWEVVLADINVASGVTNIAASAVTDRRTFAGARTELGGTQQQNLLVNGGFEVAQRGIGPFTANNGYTLDQWFASYQGTARFSVAPETTIVDAGSAQSLKFVFTQGGAGEIATISQKVEDFKELRGRTLTLSVRYRGDGGASIPRLVLYDGTISFAAVGTNVADWQTLTVTYAIPPAATTIWAQFGATGAAGTWYLDNATLAVGTVPLAYVPRHPHDELARCQRYYERLITSVRVTAGNGGEIYDYPLIFQAAKGGTASLTITPGTRNGVRTLIVDSAYSGGCRLELVTDIPGDVYALNDGLTVEWNP